MMVKHPDIEIILSDINMPEMDGLTLLAKDFRWLRVTAEAVEEAADDSARYQELALQAEPGLRAVYNDQTGHRMAFFRLEKATALVYGLTGEPEELK